MSVKILGKKRQKRGVALLLVMIALVVGTILTAGFLGTQGTSVGIARNQRDHDHARAIAESGAELCMSLVRNKTNWRATLSPGTWLSNYSLAGGTVTVTASDGAGNSSFLTDTTQPVTFSATGTYSGKSYTVSASMTPTGGGTPWSGGVFTRGQIVIDGLALVDSFDSSVGAYLISLGLNSQFWSNNTGGAALAMTGGIYGGSLTVSPSEALGSAVSLSGGLIGPTSVTQAPEPRTAGQLIRPNTTGFSTSGNYNGSGTVPLNTAAITYNNFTLTGSALSHTTVTVSRNATYYVKGDMNIDAYSTLTVGAGFTATFLVDGNVTVYGAITPKANSQIFVYAGGEYVVRGGAVVGSSTVPNGLFLGGFSTCDKLQLRDTAVVVGKTFCPSATGIIQDSSKFYGSWISQDLTVRDSAQLHYDLNMRSAIFHYIKGGSYAGDYLVKWQQ